MMFILGNCKRGENRKCLGKGDQEEEAEPNTEEKKIGVYREEKNKGCTTLRHPKKEVVGCRVGCRYRS